MSNYCEGCDSIFTRRGIISHLQQTTDPLCQQFKVTRKAAHTSLCRVDLDSEASGSESAMEDIIPFGGDRFGSADEYATADEDFGQLHEPEYANHEEVRDEEDDGGEGSADEDEMYADLEMGWEAEREAAPLYSMEAQGCPPPVVPGEEAEELGMETEEDLAGLPTDAAQRRTAESILLGDGHGITAQKIVKYNEQFPNSHAGEPIRQNQSTDSCYLSAIEGSANIWAPFKSQIDWEVAQWAKLRGPSSTAFSDLLGIPGIQEKLDLSYHNSNELNQIIDEKLPGRPKFKRHEVVIQGESLEFYARDIKECIQALWGDPDFADQLIVQPERHYAEEDELTRVYHEMHTGKWWWRTQKKVERHSGKKNCTVVPLIISSDKTQLTTFRNKTAYPVYGALGNIPKHIRRKPSRQGQVLLGYLPTSKLEHIRNKSSRRRASANLFHTCMRHILEPLEDAGRDGMILISGDGKARLCFPILATYVGDYPEQLLVTLIKTGNCAVCPVHRKQLGDLGSVLPPRDHRPILRSLSKIDRGPAIFARACAAAGIKPVQHPFWKNLPFVNIYASITPDILHQLFQGVVKHVVNWIRSAVSDAEIDTRCRRLPPNHHIRLFMKGITHLSRVTGTEHDQISKFLLALVLDVQLPDGVSNECLVRCVRSLLDFVALARYPAHTTDTLDRLEAALFEFHENKSIFVELGIRTNFNIPKLHFTAHYHHLFEEFGSGDNYNTESTERLHIDMAKRAYAASNRKDEYAQMTDWLDRREKVLLHAKFVQRRLEALDPAHKPIKLPPPCLIPHRSMKMTKHPTQAAVSLDVIRTKYGTVHFKAALARFIVQYQHPDFDNGQIERGAASFHLPLAKLAVFHRIKFVSHDIHSLDPLTEHVVDSIHVEPERYDKYHKLIPGRFDTVIVDFQNGGGTGLQGHCVGRVRCIFSLPPLLLARWFPRGLGHKHLAYVEWFIPFSQGVLDPSSKLYQIRPYFKGTGARRERQASVIPISLITQSTHLFPKFGPHAPVTWKSSNVLDATESFYVNSFSDRFPYSTLY